MVKLIACLCSCLFAVSAVWAQDSLTVTEARKSVTLTGYTRSRAKQTLASEVAGKVLKVHYDVGDSIHLKPFVEIDTTFIDFQIEHTQQTLAKLNVAGSRNASQVAFLEKEFKRVDTLHQDNVATLAKWEGAAEQLDQARLALQTTDVEINALKIQLKELKERRKRHKVVAPPGWVIVQRQVEPGEIIAAGTPLGQAADFTRLVVPLFVSGTELAAIQQLNPLKVLVDGRPARAVLNWINPDFDERTRKLAVELALVDFKGQVRGGLLTELTFHVPTEGMMVPKAAVTRRYDNPSVVLKADGQSVPISILGESGNYILISDTAALRPGMELEAGR